MHSASHLFVYVGERSKASRWVNKVSENSKSPEEKKNAIFETRAATFSTIALWLLFHSNLSARMELMLKENPHVPQVSSILNLRSSNTFNLTCMFILKMSS